VHVLYPREFVLQKVEDQDLYAKSSGGTGQRSDKGAYGLSLLVLRSTSSTTGVEDVRHDGNDVLTT
jgi:hypothetical protein